MLESSDKDQEKRKIIEVKTFSVPFSLKEIKKDISISTNSNTQTSKEQIMNQAFEFHSQGNISEAAKYYQLYINKGFADHRIFSNYGNILKDLGKLQEAEIFVRKAIQTMPNFAYAHSNLGLILRDLGKSKEAEVSTRKAIELNPNYAEAHFNLGLILRDLGKSKEAEVSTRKAIELNPNYADAHEALGRILNELGRKIESNECYKKALDLKPWKVASAWEINR